MSILKVARIAHPVVRWPAKPVPKEAFRDRLFQKLVDDMRETMYEYEGVGLAAPQIGEVHLADVHAIHADRAPLHIIEAQQE